MRVKRVVAGVDFTPRSLAAARWAASHFAPDAAIVLTHVVPVPTVPRFLRPIVGDAEGAVNGATPAMLGALRGVASTIGERRSSVDVRCGDPASGLINAVVNAEADLLCIARGRERQASQAAGETLRRLLRDSPVPVLVAVGSPAAEPSRILAGVGDDALGDAALRVAAAIAARTEAHLDAMHVLDAELEEHARAVASSAPVAFARHIARHASPERLLLDRTEEWLRERLADVGAAPGRSAAIAAYGDAGREIVARARRSGAQLIVLGSASDAGRAPAGLTQFVTMAAPCPVLVLPCDTGAESLSGALWGDTRATGRWRRGTASP